MVSVFKKAEMAKTLRNELSMSETNHFNHKWLDVAIQLGLALHQFQKKMLLSLFLFLMSYVCMLFVWMLFELIFCGVALKNTCRVQDSIIPKHIIFPLIFTIDLFLFAMTWVYLSGCIHKHLIQYNFCFAPLIIYFYK